MRPVNTPLAAAITVLAAFGTGVAQPSKPATPPFRYVWAKAYHIPPETTTVA